MQVNSSEQGTLHSNNISQAPSSIQVKRRLSSHLEESSSVASLHIHSNFSQRNLAENGNSSINVLQLEQHCKNLEDELDQVKFQIVKIVSDKNDFSKENAVLKTYQNAFATLTEQNEILKKRLEGFTRMEISNETPTIIPDIDRSSPDGQEKDSHPIVKCRNNSEYEDVLVQLKENMIKLVEEKSLMQDNFKEEKKEILEKNK